MANRLARRFEHVIATQDWHPADHLSFASQHPGKSPGDIVDLDGLPQTLWPDHCVQETAGAELRRGLDVGRIDTVIRKAATACSTATARSSTTRIGGRPDCTSICAAPRSTKSI